MALIDRPLIDNVYPSATTFTDSQTWSATVASTGETTLGNISVPAGETWVIYSIWCGGYGGFYRLDITGTNAMADFVGKFIQNDVNKIDADDDLREMYTGPYATDILVRGAATLTMYVTNSGSGSTLCKGMIQYRRYIK